MTRPVDSTPTAPALGADADPAEWARVQAVLATGLLDAADTGELDDLPALAAETCGTPMAAMSLLDPLRQVLVGQVGLGVRETQRAVSFCNYTIGGPELFEVGDTHADPRFRDNPLVTGAPGIRSYAGVPVLSPDGHRVGALFVADRVPRVLDAAARARLERLARQASRTIALRSAAGRLERVGRAQDAAVAALGRAVDAERLDHAFEGLLADLLAISGSAYGFIGEVHSGRDGQPFLRTHAITNIAWDATSLALYERTAATGMEFHRLDTLFGHVMASGEALYTDHPATDPRRGGLPPGHPPLSAFVGLPVQSRGRMVGMVGLANRPGGYTPGLARDLEPVLAAIAALVEAARAERVRRAAEAELAQQREAALENERRFRAALESLEHVAVQAYTADGRITFWNRASETLYGWPAGETVGRDIVDLLFPPEAREAERRLLDEVSRSGDVPSAGEIEVLRRDGGSAAIYASRVLVARADGPPEFFCFDVDITERQRAAAALAQSEARYRAIAENIPGAIFRYLLDPEGRHSVEFISTGARAIWEHEPAAIVANPPLMSQAMAPEDRDAFRATLQASARTLAVWQHRWRITTPSGRRKWLQGSGRPTRRANGDIAWDGYVFDVTERREAEAALATSEARLRVLIDAAPDAIVVIDAQARRIVDFNQSALDLYGLDADSLRRADPMSLRPPRQPDGRDSAAVAAEMMQRAIAGEVLSMEWTILRSDGREVPCEVHCVRLPDPERTLLRASLVDMTARKAAEAALRLSEARLGLVVRNMIDGFFAIDADWRYIDINAAAARYTGLEPGQLIGRDLREFFPGAGDSVFGRAYAAAMAGAEPATVVDHYAPLDRWFEARVQPLGGGAAVFFSDITERKRAEIALRESERRFRSLVENIGTIAVQGYDRERRIVFWNRASEQLYGWTAAEALGRRLEETIIPEPMRQAVVELHSRWVADGRIDVPAEELVLVDRSGLPVPVYSSHIMQRQPDGEVVMYCLDVDLRDLRRTEAALQEANAALRQRNEELQQFVMIASHDLQEPLRKVQTFADRLQAALQGRMAAHEADYLERLLAAATRMRTLIQDLLDYSAVSFNAPQRGRVDLDQVLGEVLDDLEQAIAGSGAVVQRGPLGVLQADPVQMRQLLQNLVGNALKYRHPARAPRIRVDAGAAPGPGSGILRVRVADNGIGFDDAHRERIFAPFQRLHARSEYEGTGIGLAIVRRIVERHGGRIEARGRPGEGAEFVLELPARD